MQATFNILKALTQVKTGFIFCLYMMFCADNSSNLFMMFRLNPI